MAKNMFYGSLTVPDSASNVTLLSEDQPMNIDAPSDLSDTYVLYWPKNAQQNLYALNRSLTGQMSWTFDYYDKIFSSAIIPSAEGDITFATASGSANIAASSGNTVKYIVGGTDVATINETKLSVDVSTQSSSTSTGALTTSGGVGIAKNMYVGGLMDITGSTNYIGGIRVGDIDGTENIEASNVSGDLNMLVSGTVNFTGNNSVRGVETNILSMTSSTTSFSLNKKETWRIDTFNDSNVSATNLFSSSLTAGIKHIVLNSENDISYYTANSPYPNVPMHIFLTANAAGVEANIDFGESNLYIGSTKYRYLILTETGQSSHAIYMTNANDSDLNGWRVFNTGAYVIGSDVSVTLLSSGNQDGAGEFTVGASINKDMYQTSVSTTNLVHYPNIDSVTLVTTTAYKWSDWQGDIFDGWGNFYIYDTNAGTKNGSAEFYFITFTNPNAADGTITTETQTAFGKTFTIKYGYPVQGIFVLDVSTNDGGTFQVGAGGNMGSDSNTRYTEETTNYNVGETTLTLYNLYNYQLNSSTEKFRVYVVPYNVSDNLSITYEYEYVGNRDNVGIFSKPFTNGIITYFAKTNDVSDWIIADIGGV